MSKNPHKKPTPKLQSVLDEQNEPCCRAIWKKIRNANKKLLEIQDLEKKDDLKPQQVQKVNRKKGLLEEKSRYEQFLGFYKTTLTQNAQVYRQIQLKQLRNLADALTLASYGKTNEGCRKEQLTHLWGVLVNPSKKQTVSERAQSLADSFNRLANDQNLKKWVAQSIQKNGDNLFVEVKTEAKQQTSAKVQDSPKPKEKKAPKVDTPKPEKVEEKVEQPKKEVVQVNVVVSQKVEQTEQTTPAQQGEKTEQKIQVQGNQQGKKGERKDGRPPRGRGTRGPREDRGEQGEKGQRKRNFDNRDNNDRKKYKPKFVKKDESGKDNQSSSQDSEEKLPEVRDFKRQEVRELIEDGFVVVGKPKIKSHEQKKWHEHTHGHKFHHHKQNI